MLEQGGVLALYRNQEDGESGARADEGVFSAGQVFRAARQGAVICMEPQLAAVDKDSNVVTV